MQQVLIESARAKAAPKRIPPQLVSELLPDLDGTRTDPELHLTLKIVTRSKNVSEKGF